jgi:hypothetical protein
MKLERIELGGFVEVVRSHDSKRRILGTQE